MKIMDKTIKKRDEIVVSIRDMVFVLCGTALVITGHLYFAIAAFVCAAFRFDLSGYMQLAKKMQEAEERMMASKHIVDQLVETARKHGLVDDKWFENYKETMKCPRKKLQGFNQGRAEGVRGQQTGEQLEAKNVDNQER